jgi:hypothetical protein
MSRIGFEVAEQLGKSPAMTLVREALVAGEGRQRGGPGRCRL